MNSYDYPGITVEHTPSGADVLSGDFVDGVGAGVGFADGSGIKDGVTGALLCAGIVNVDNPDDTAFALGATVGWDAVNKKAVVAAGGTFDIGTVYYLYVAGELKVRVAINGLIGSQ